MATWSLRVGADERTFADWAMSGATRSRRSQARDSFRFTRHVAADADQFAFEADARVFRDGVQWFRGNVVSLPRSGSGSSESIGVEVAGPWYWLEQMIYQVQVQSYVGALSGLNHSSHILLNIAPGAVLKSTEQTVKDLIDYAVARGAPLQRGDVDLKFQGVPLTVPVEEIRDHTVAEVIQKALRYHPDAVAWFDYQADPPALHVKNWAALEPAAWDITTLESWELRPRYDLVRDAVVIRYERSLTVDGVEKLQFLLDAWPQAATGLEVGALVFTTDLRGPTVSHAEQYVEVVPLDLTNIEWWKRRCPTLADPNISPPTINAGWPQRTIDYLSLIGLGPPANLALTNQVVAGLIADWMPVAQEDQQVEARFSYVLYDRPFTDPSKKLIRNVTDHPETERIVATNAVTGTYKSQASVSPGDPVPVGLARALYESLNRLYWEGQVTHHFDEIFGRDAEGNSLGRKRTITGGRAEWTTMNTVVQEISEDWDSGSITTTFGPPQHLGVQDLIELVR